MDSLRRKYLAALDIDVWERRVPAGTTPAVAAREGRDRESDPSESQGTGMCPAAVGGERAAKVAPFVASPEGRDRESDPSESQGTGMRPAAAGGERAAKVAPFVASPEGRDRESDPSEKIERMPWSLLEQTVSGCTRCGLHRTRTQTVFGVGNREAEWMVIGEAPGADEDARGEPFVGRAGQLLNSMLRAMGFAREQVFIANILKCRPPSNRDPSPEEARSCLPYLFRQIELVNPRLILCVGRIAAQTLLSTDTPIGKLRGKVHRLPGVGRPVVVTYHPAYLLRSPGEKRKAWQDLLLGLRTSEELGSEEN